MSIAVAKSFTVFQLLLLVLLLYPLLYALPYVGTLGYTLEVAFLVVLTAGLLLWNFFVISKQGVGVNFMLFLGLLFMVVVVVANTDSLRYIKPLVFILYLFNVYILARQEVDKKWQGIGLLAILVYLLASVFQLFRDSAYAHNGRFTGFEISPTTYTVYLEVALVILFFIPIRLLYKIVIAAAFGWFIVLTQTRLNLVFFLLLPFLYLLITRINFSKRLLMGLFVGILALLYPVYNLLINTSIMQALIISRYGEARDASFGLRAYLQALAMENLQEASWTELLFTGQGSETARLLVMDKTGTDLFIHNDYLRLVIDFGLLFTVLYLLVLYKIARRNNLSFLLLLLYLFSFYHNMVYSFFCPGLIVLFSQVNTGSKNAIAHE